jgi:FkbM family methyltransferase
MIRRALSGIRKKLGLVSYSEMMLLHDVHLLAQARMGDFWADQTKRKKSNEALIKLFYGLVRETEPRLFIEAGALSAFASQEIRKYLPKARIVAFEASPENYATFSASEPFKQKRIDYRHCAVSDRTGTIDLQVRDDGFKNFEANSVMVRTEDQYPVKTVTVPSTTLDDAFPNCPSCALWIDVEGASQQLIAGAQNVLRKANVVMIEVEVKPYWKGQWMATDVSIAMMKLGLVPVARDFEMPAQYNMVFLRASLLRRHPLARRRIEYFHSVLSKL